MLKVLHVGPSLSLKGGIVTIIKNFYKEQSFFKKHGYSQHIFESTPKRGILGYLIFLSQTINFVQAAYSKDIIHFHVASNGSFYRKIILFLISFTLRKKTIVHLHGGGFFDFIDNSDKITRRLIFLFFTKSTSIIVVSKYSATQLSKRINVASKIFLVPNSSPEFETLPAIDNKKNSPSVILFCGTLISYKGLDDLLQALKILKSRNINVILNIAGPGEIHPWKERTIELGIEDRVTFCGWVDGDKKIELYSNATIFCLPSHFESFGISVLEAMHCGKAVVCTSAGGLPDLVEHMHNGLLSTPGNIPELAENLMTILASETDIERYGVLGRIKAQKDFSTDNALRCLLHTYKHSS